MQATTSPKLADQRPAAQAALAAIVLAAGLAVVGAFGIAAQQSAPAAPAAAVGDHEASGFRNAAAGSPTDRYLDGAAIRRANSGPLVSKPTVRVPTVWLGTNPGPGTGSVATDPMAQFNATGLSIRGADETQKVGRSPR
jgi:hypothetical protein